MGLESPKSSDDAPSRPFSSLMLALGLALSCVRDRVDAQTGDAVEVAGAVEAAEALQRLDVEIRQFEETMGVLKAELNGYQLPPRVKEHLEGLWAFFEENKKNSYKNMLRLEAALETDAVLKNNEPKATDFFYSKAALFPGENARFLFASRTILLPEASSRQQTFLDSLVSLHEVDHAYSWYLRLQAPGRSTAFYNDKFLLNEEAGRYALMLEILDVKMQGKLRGGLSGDAVGTEALKTEFAHVLGITVESPGVQIMWNLAAAYFPSGGIDHFPEPFLRLLYTMYKDRAASVSPSVEFKVYLEDAGGNLVPYE